MSTIDTGAFKERLLDERRHLRAAINNLHSEHAGGGSLEDETQELAVADNHPGDVATETFDRELDEGLEEGAERQLAQIDAALARIENGSYGTCAICGRPIGEDRLRAVPWATLCIDDQRKQEQA
jgi:RNA polymerase-binding protein DksA